MEEIHEKSFLERTKAFFNIVEVICLAMVVFGVFTLGFFVAPEVFRNIPERELASEVMTIIFLKYYPFAFSCMAIAITIELISLLSFGKELFRSKLWLTQFTFVLFVGVLTAYSNFSLTPQINEMRLENNSPSLWGDPDFVRLHQRSEKAAKAMFLFGLIPLGIISSGKRRSKS